MKNNLEATEKELERAVLVAVRLPELKRWEVEDFVEELRMLADTAYVEVKDVFIQDKDQLDSKYFVGKGKANEIKSCISEKCIDVVIFDDELSTGQIKNLENLFDIKVIDRSQLILDIFADHAKSREAKTQVELAQLNYTLPRLTRMWTHLSRQKGGGIGLRGPGETQLETDKRLIQKRISHLKEDLEKIEKQRSTRRKGRHDIFKVTLVGYTNVGKSTIMRQLTGADVLVENKLFATLDSTVRKVFLNKEHQILLADTVGFIRKLPHHLVASFQSTLVEATDADLLLHIVDLSHPNHQDHIRTVNSVLNELDIGDKPILLVFNKIDAVELDGTIQQAKLTYPDAIFVSALKRLKLNDIRKNVLSFIEKNFSEKELILSHKQSFLLSSIYALATVLEENYSDNGIELKIKISNDNYNKLMKIKERKELELSIMK
jgi:GTPase